MSLTVRIPGVEVGDELGHGAFSTVYRATYRDTRCALKVPHVRGRWTRWVYREAVALARVRHPGLPRVVEVGEADELPYLLMELVEGETLADRLAREPLDRDAVLDLACQLADTLRAIHEVGLVHRDVKPRNIILQASGKARLVDFGFAAPVGSVAAGDAAGTRRYSAPEQFSTPDRVDARADLYALGRVTFECLTGRPPSTGDPTQAIVDLTTSGVPVPIARVVGGMLAPAPSDRYCDAANLLAELHRVRGGGMPRGPAACEPMRVQGTLIGRDAEVGRFTRVWREAATAGGAVLVIEGVSGAGKTRFTRTCLALVRDEGRGRVVECTARERDAPLATVRRIFESYIASLSRLPPQEKAAATTALRASALGPLSSLACLVTPLFAEILGVKEVNTSAIPDAFAEGVAELVLRLARLAGPLLVSLDDLQWCDSLSLEVLSAVAARVQEAPLLLVIATRPQGSTVLDRFHAARSRPPTHIALGPLEMRQGAALVAAHLGVASLEPGLAQRIMATANGTPAGVLEGLAAFLDAGALRFSENAWTLDAGRADGVVLPEGAIVYLGSRVAELPPASRRVLQAASLLGTHFQDALLAGLLGIEVNDVGHALADGRRAGLLQANDNRGHSFAHDSVREMLSAGIDSGEARRLHQRAAEILAEKSAATPDLLYDAAAHFALGEPERTPALAHQVARRAAEMAFERFDNETALRFFAKAESWRDATMAVDAAFHRKVGEASLRTGALAESLRAFEAALELPGVPAARAAILGRIAWVRRAQGDTEGAFSALGQAFDLLGVHMPTGQDASVRPMPSVRRDTPVDPELLNELCQQHVRLSFEVNPQASLQGALRMLELAKVNGPSVALARANITYGALLARLGRRSESNRRLLLAQGIATELGDPSTIAFCIPRRVAALAYEALFDETLELLHDSVEQYGPWLETTEFVDTVVNGEFIEAIRGRATLASKWIFSGVDRLSRRKTANAPTPAYVLYRARAALASLGRPERELQGLTRQIVAAESTSAAGQRSLYRAVCWGPRARYLYDTNDIGPAFEDLAREFQADGHDPASCHPVLYEFFIVVAHVRVQQCLRASGAERAVPLAALRNAANDLRKAAKLAPYRAHSLMADGYLAWFEGSSAKAERLLAKAGALAIRETCPWVLWGVARARAHMLRAEGKTDAARDQARIAEMLAREHGAEPRARWVREEFGLVVTSALAQAGSSVSGARSSRRARHHLGSLLHIARAPYGELKRAQQVIAIVDDLVRELGAERVHILFELPDAPRASLALGRSRLGETLPPPTGWRDALMRSVMDRAEASTAPVGAIEGQDVPDRRRVLVAPLFLHERALGAVCIERGAAARAFDGEDHELLLMLGHQIPLGLELSRLLEDRDAMQASLQQAQKMEVVGQLAGGIAHDVNNMLQTVHVGLQGLQDNDALDENAQDDVKLIEEGVSRATKLTRKLLTFSRQQPLTLAVTDVNKAVLGLESMVRRFAGKTSDVALVFDLDPAVPHAMTDEASLEQALINLVINARDAIRGAGSIRIATRNVVLDEDAVRRGAPAAGRYVSVELTDNGEGMSPEVMARIFDPLFTTKPAGQGTGLGLTMVYTFVRQTGGHIEVESEVGRGTTFRIHLPAAEAVAVEARTSPPQQTAPGAVPAMILVVDDDPRIRKLTQELLQRDGYRVMTAAGSSDALDLVRSKGHEIALVILDLSMPEMGGQELGRRLADLHVPAKVLFVSGYGRAALEGSDLAGAPTLQKPFTSGDLLGRVRGLLSN